jgi:predicted dehydrogenase
MLERAREKGVMTQMGIQVSSDFTERLAVELIQLGAIGKVKEAHTFSNKKWGDMETCPTKSDPIPAGLRLGLWLGPPPSALHQRLLSSQQLAQTPRLRHRHTRRHGLPHVQRLVPFA